MSRLQIILSCLLITVNLIYFRFIITIYFGGSFGEVDFFEWENIFFLQYLHWRDKCFYNMNRCYCTSLVQM
jgi:hypothetical protein